MESPTDSIKKIMNHLKQKFNQENKTESIHSLPSLKESALENYCKSKFLSFFPRKKKKLTLTYFSTWIK